ncbi:hypothetical protein TNCT_292361 [Trichonephila clavata]|uniref:Uncharacterized protein n=1 Tax=Trichonephila clavata TaxID=2740835 RepID=A0A8X6LLX6_TRICU|nr:hypothetical protein TNCT_292361 [Trichonephila clavata]
MMNLLSSSRGVVAAGAACNSKRRISKRCNSICRCSASASRSSRRCSASRSSRCCCSFTFKSFQLTSVVAAQLHVQVVAAQLHVQVVALSLVKSCCSASRKFSFMFKF